MKLRSLQTSDLDTLRRFVNDPEIMRTSNTYMPVSDLDQQRWFETVQGSSDRFWFVVEAMAEDQPSVAGTCCLTGVDWIGRVAELRIRIGRREFWGRGYGTEASSLLLSYGFDHLNLERIWLRVYSSNPRAYKMYEKLGFVQEGCLRQAAFLMGKREDVILLGLLRSEWRQGPGHGGAIES